MNIFWFWMLNKFIFLDALIWILYWFWNGICTVHFLEKMASFRLFENVVVL